jgi:inositol phosphorylceramide synthase regulatory subunit
VLYFAHMFFLDHVFSTCWTVFFGVVWWAYTPHDGKRVANSDAQRAMMDAASGMEGHNMTEDERTQAALGIWNKEKGFAAAVLILGWLTKVCPHPLLL